MSLKNLKFGLRNGVNELRLLIIHSIDDEIC